MEIELKDIAAGVDRLKGMVITLMPDCLLYDSWIAQTDGITPEEVATYFGDLMRANQEALRSMDAVSDEMQVTIESGHLLIVMRRIRTQFVATFLFENDAPLGMLRLYTRRMLGALKDHLPSFEAEAQSRGARVLKFLERYAPDPHTALLRVAVKAKIPLDTLQDADALSGETLEDVERAICDILGLESLNL